MAERHKDYFAFETIRDAEQKIVCYYVTMIGTIEEEGIVHIRTDLEDFLSTTRIARFLHY